MTAAPASPGAIGTAPEPIVLQAYLGELDDWVRARRAELDELDAAALAAQRGAEVASDMALSLALWKAVSDRWQLMWATWDGGRVGVTERTKITTLIWGRLDGTLPTQSLAVSLPEACRLSDALAGQLRTTLSLVPGADAAAARIKELRAQLERVRDQVALEPAIARDQPVDRLAGLLQRLADVTERAQRGADVGGLLGPLENDASTLERDLIVGNARRRDARDQLASARELRADLLARAEALSALAATCVRTVDPSPRYAVPDVEALGPIPNTPEALAPYLTRLDRVSQALTLAQQKYADALAERTQLLDLLEAYVAKAGALGIADRPDLADSERRAREVLAREPAPMAVCRQLVSTYQTWVDHSKESA
ncbi:hypothetical protein ASC77_05040 [Nocardioides sp. Root1257]|uniref:hypothetical protein n=1 Tax=unclassified Nocardioides TaxID=2615069 RepID=UPI0006F4CF18|nr:MULTISPECIES: hypothetical protein [unclassified Nocardioides]KQW53635.1 hypothetical protein ASC77_05040 [Nocardioides sp. Root1257]KRC56321.1 hypothetical protein ASE24_05040 [Nocardioides sp. Root224]